MRIYIAGPITGVLDFQETFRAAAKHLDQLGHNPVSPTSVVLPPGATWQDYMRHTAQQLIWCDGVALLPGWQQSKGAQIERQWAEAVGLLVLPLDQWKKATD